MREPFAQAHLQHLLHPSLADHQRQQDGDDGEEDQKLVAEMRQVPLRQRIEEGAVPVIEADLADHVTDEHHDDAGGEQADAQPRRRMPKRTQQGETLARGASAFVSCGGRTELHRRLSFARVGACVTVRDTELVRARDRSGVLAGRVSVQLLLHVAGPPRPVLRSQRLAVIIMFCLSQELMNCNAAPPHCRHIVQCRVHGTFMCVLEHTTDVVFCNGTG